MTSSRHPGRADHVVDCLLARPTLGVQAGVDDQPRSSEQLGLEAPEIAEWIVLVHADLRGELLGIQRPAFGVCRVQRLLADQRQVLETECGRDLEVMARNALVVGERLHCPGWRLGESRRFAKKVPGRDPSIAACW